MPVHGTGSRPISALVLAGQQRLTLPPEYRLDTFFYCDEAGDYIATEPKLEEIIDKFRKVRIATLWAIQREGNIKDSGVLDALNHCSIKLTPSSLLNYRFNYEVKGKFPITVFVDPVKPKPKHTAMTFTTPDQPKATEQPRARAADKPRPHTTEKGIDGEIIPPNRPTTVDNRALPRPTKDDADTSAR